MSWARINFSWFASAYDTDDWVFRLTTTLQMVGVLVLTLGIPELFSSIADGRYVNDRVLVAGYVVMRVAVVIQRSRAAKQDPDRRSACLTYASATAVAQVGWVAVSIADHSVGIKLARSRYTRSRYRCDCGVDVVIGALVLSCGLCQCRGARC